MNDKTKIESNEINLAEMSDDEVATFDASKLEELEETPGSENQESQSADDTSTAENETDETGGADSENESTEDTVIGADSTSTEELVDDGNDDETTDQQQQSSTSDQDVEQSAAAPEETQTSTETINPEVELAKVFAPFKASKRTIQVKSVDDVRRLMQMGADYTRKMTDMKPYTRMLKTLEKNDLLDEEKINFLIDLDKKDPAAMKKFFKDSEIDPMDLSYEDDTESYKPTDHMIPEGQLDLDEVLDEIRPTESFARTAKVITDDWDTVSKRVLLDNPEVIRTINNHMESGIYDQISDNVANERLFGRLTGLSDLDAYKKVGDAMHAAGKFKPHQNATSNTGNTNQDFSQDSGSSADAEKLRNRKLAASPTKGSASAGKAKINIGAMSDKEIENFDLSTL